MGIRAQSFKQQQAVASRQTDVEKNHARLFAHGDAGGLKGVPGAEAEKGGVLKKGFRGVESPRCRRW